MAKIPIARPYLDSNERLAVAETLDSGWISQGPKCAEFEQAVADIVGVKHGRSVNSGTNAIHLALLACGIRPGDEVIVPAFTCVATLFPLEYIGARPVPVDIELETFGMDAAALPDAVTPQTRGIIPVHMAGAALHIEDIVAFAAEHGLAAIEDAALGLGAGIGRRRVGSFGDAACLSFHPRKMVTTGEGGMVLTNSDAVADTVGRLRSYGASVPAWRRHEGDLFALPAYEEVGYNCKLTDIQASIGLVQMGKLTAMLAMRRKIAQRYDEAFASLEWLRSPAEPAGHAQSYQSYICLLQARDETPDALEALRLRLWKHLAAGGIAGVQAAQSMATIAVFQRKYGWKPEAFPVALKADRATVALPIFPGLTDEDQERVIEAVHSFQP